MDVNGLKQRIGDQLFTLKKAETLRIKVAQEREKLSNILVNNVDEIIEVLDYVAKADERIARLAAEVESADAELQEKDDEIAALKKTKAKAKKPDVE